jgi:hypothetical protein
VDKLVPKRPELEEIDQDLIAVELRTKQLEQDIKDLATEMGVDLDDA